MKYCVIKTTFTTDNEEEENYGIMLVDDTGYREFICDVTDSLPEIIELAGILNSNSINPCHMNSVIEDYKYKKKCKNM